MWEECEGGGGEGVASEAHVRGHSSSRGPVEIEHSLNTELNLTAVCFFQCLSFGVLKRYSSINVLTLLL